MTRAPHPAETRTNRYEARCAKCGHIVKAGEGTTEKIMGTTKGWRTEHLPGECNTLEQYQDTVHPFSSEAFEH
jgi:hypothetical protein